MGKNFPSLGARLRFVTRVAWAAALVAIVSASVFLVITLIGSSNPSGMRPSQSKVPPTAPKQSQSVSENLMTIFSQRTLQEVAPPKPVPPPVAQTRPSPPAPPKPPEVELVATVAAGTDQPFAYVRMKGSRSLLKLPLGGETDGCKVIEIEAGHIVVETNGDRFQINVRKGS